jgi:excisionase family DNA binding protein
MKLEDVAERLGKSKRTVMRMVDEGRWPRPAIRKGRLVVWSDAAVERAMRRRRNGKGGK